MLIELLAWLLVVGFAVLIIATVSIFVFLFIVGILQTIKGTPQKRFVDEDETEKDEAIKFDEQDDEFIEELDTDEDNPEDEFTPI